MNQVYLLHVNPVRDVMQHTTAYLRLVTSNPKHGTAAHTHASPLWLAAADLLTSGIRATVPRPTVAINQVPIAAEGERSTPGQTVRARQHRRRTWRRRR